MVAQRRDNPDSAAVRAALTCGRRGCACVSGPNTHCPAHDDPSPSLTISAGEQTALIVHCHAGCPAVTVIAALRERGLWPSGDAVRPASTSAPAQPAQTLVAIYDYRAAAEPAGPVVAQKARYEGRDGSKVFRWRRAGEERWIGLDGLTLDSLALWGAETLLDLAAEEPVVIVEGEKAVEAARSLGLVALCHAGGASTTRFAPEALAPLTGRDVILWPDNDAPGRELMTRLYAAIRPLARSLRFLTPPLPLKGDAADYLAAGGTSAALFADLPPARTDVTALARDAFRVRVPTPAGVATLSFDGLEQSGRRDLDCELTVAVGGGHEPLIQRVNLISGTQRTDLRRDLDALYGKEWGWTAVLVDAFSRVRRAWTGQERAVRVDQILDPGDPQFLVGTLLPDASPSVIFGDGSSGKTYIALAAALAVARGEPFCGMAVRQGAVLYVDYETSEPQFRLRVGRLCRGLGLDGVPPGLPMYYWPGGGGALADQADALKRFCAEKGVVLVIVDSAADACGGEPESAEVASRYFNGLSRINGGIASLTIAHVSKGSDAEKPFGSVFWHNRPRRTWNVQRVQEEESDEADIGLYCRKVNDGRKPQPFAIRLTFEGTAGPVRVMRGDLGAVPELAAKRGLRERVREALRRGPLTVAQIAAGVGGGVAPGTIGDICRRYPAQFVRVDSGGRGVEARWALLAKSESSAASRTGGTNVPVEVEMELPW